MATTWTNVISITDGGTPVIYQQETSPPDAGTGAGNRHRIVENGIEYDPTPQGVPARSPGYIASSGFDPSGALHWAGENVGEPTLSRITLLSPT